MNMIDFGMDAQAALDAPRICIQPDNGEISLEHGIDGTVLQALRDMGHNVHSVCGHARAIFGRGQIIRKISTGLSDGTGLAVYEAGSDPRADGCAMALC